MKKVLLLCIISLGCFKAVLAQDDLLDDLAKEDASKPKKNITSATFKSTRVINMQSVEMTGKGNLQFMVSHHFGNIWNKGKGFQNAAQLFGLNGGMANTYLSLDYSPCDYLNLGGAATGNSLFEGWAKIKLLRQQTGVRNYPVSVVWHSLMHADAGAGASPGNFTWNRFSYMHQLLVARKFNEKFSLQFNPTVVHYNYIPYGYQNDNNIYSVGMGGRYKLNHKTAVTFEYSRQLNGYFHLMTEDGSVVEYSPDLVSIGYDWDTGGHIFQFFASSTTHASNVAQLSRNPNYFAQGNFALGFTINRSMGVKKVVKAAE